VKRLALAAGLIAALICTAPASAAFTPPELFVRQQAWDTHEDTGPWIPLASAPAFDYLGGYQIGYRLQDSGLEHGFQRVAIAIAAVPDGQPSQPYNEAPYCVGRAGTPGEIVDAGPELQFEGSGVYTVRVSVGADLDCTTAGQSSTGSFSVASPVAALLVGTPVRFRAQPPSDDTFVGVRGTPDPPGGAADVRCALDGSTLPDGSVTGADVVPKDLSYARQQVTEESFTRPGSWTCAARGVGYGIDAEFSQAMFGTPWSAPITFDVLSDFRRGSAAVAGRRSRRPRFAIGAEWPAEAAGGKAKLVVYRACTHKKVASGSAVFGAAKTRIAVKRPRRAGFYLGVLSFSGTHFLRKSTDPLGLLLAATRRKLGFVSPSSFPQC